MREEEKTIRCGWRQAETQRDVGPKTFRRIRCAAPPGDQKRVSATKMRNEAICQNAHRRTRSLSRLFLTLPHALSFTLLC